MKNVLLLFITCFALSIAQSTAQTCSGSLAGSTTAPCLNQPFTISTPFSTAFGGSITWEVSSTSTGPWTTVGTTAFNGNNGQATITITPTVSGVFYYRGVRTSCTFTPITITVGSSTAPSPSVVTASVICSGVATLTAAGNGSGTYVWYRRNAVSQISQVQTGASNQYIISTLPVSGDFFNEYHDYYVTYSDGTCTSSPSSLIRVIPAGVSPSPPSITAADNRVCYGKSTTLTATGDMGTVNWYKTTNSGTSLGTGNAIAVTPTSSPVVSQYFATNTVSTCRSVGSNVVSVSAVAPAAITDVAAEENFVVSTVSATTLISGDCKVIAEFTTSDPSGGEIYGKTVNVKVSFDATLQAYNGRPYVQRHYNLHPVAPLTSGYDPFYSPTMYFTQAEFDAFNTVSSAKLPTGPSDNAGIARLRILHAYGTPNSLPATPGNYSAGNVIEDCFPCQSVNWIADLNAWQVRINTRGFSGFFITAENATALPVTLAEFRAQPDEAAIHLHWKTVAETNFRHYEIQRSAHPASGFENVGTLKNQGRATGGTYTFRDDQVSPGNWYYYRLRMVDLDGSFAYSRIIASRLGQEVGIKVFPNPAHTELTFTSAERITEYKLINPSGQLIQRKAGLLTDRETVMLPTLPAGMYLLHLQTESRRTETRHVVIQ